MARVLAIVPLLTACTFHAPSGAGSDDDGGNSDAPLADASPLCPGIGLDLPSVCMAKLPTMPQELANGEDLDTGDDDRCDPAISRYCVIEATAITVSDSLAIGGDRPLVLMATESITIDGANAAIDAKSRRGVDMADRGPGADGAMCGNGTAPSGGGPYGGGAGGSFHGKGGDGGDGAGVAGSKGTAAAMLRPTVLQGGCPGQDGGGGGGGPRGHGGGAIYMVAPVITLGTGVVINASGGSAYGSDGGQGPGSAGGGGGSGGMIVFDTDRLAIAPTALVFANGGAGGEGAGGNHGGDGIDSVVPSMAAIGGLGGSTQGGDGGNGGVADTIAGAGKDGTSGGGGVGGGGGGGSVGWILVFRSEPPAPSTNVSPAITH